MHWIVRYQVRNPKILTPAGAVSMICRQAHPNSRYQRIDASGVDGTPNKTLQPELHAIDQMNTGAAQLAELQ